METRYASASLPGRRHMKTGNEDSSLAIDLGNGWYAFSVLDGISSLRDGYGTSRLAGNIIENHLRSFHERKGSIKAYLCQLVIRVQQEVLFAQSEGIPTGTTMTLCLVDNNTDTLHTVHIGDSPVLCIHQGEIYPLTVEDDIIDPRNGQTHLAKYIGQSRPIDEGTLYSTTSLQDGDKLIICSDGLTSPFKGKESALLQMTESVNELKDIAENMAKTAQLLGTDDVTLIIIDYHTIKGGQENAPIRVTEPINGRIHSTKTHVALWITIAFFLGVLSSFVILRPYSRRNIIHQETDTSNNVQYEYESQD